MRRLARHVSLWGAGASVRTVLLTGVRVQVWPLPCGWGGPWGTLTRKGHLSMRILCLLPTVLSLYPHPKGARQPLQFARTAETHGNALCSWSGGKPWPLLIPQGESRHVPEGLHGTGRQPDPRQAVCSRAAGQGWQLPPTVPTSARHSRWALLPWGFLRAARKVQALLRPVPERTESLGLSQRLGQMFWSELFQLRINNKEYCRRWIFPGKMFSHILPNDKRLQYRSPSMWQALC